MLRSRFFICSFFCIYWIWNYRTRHYFRRILITLVHFYSFLIKHLNKRSASRPKTNAHALIGKRARIVESIEDIHHIGRVVIDGDNWQARATEGTPIQVGEQVIVESIDSIILTVRRANEPSSTAL